MTQLTMIMMLAIGLNNHVILIPLLLCVAGRDAWFSVCLTSLFALMLMGVMQYIIRVSKQHHLGSWLRAQTRPMFANMLLCLVALPLFVTAVVTLRDTVSWAEISILPTTPSIVLVVALAAVCCYMAYAGITPSRLSVGSSCLSSFCLVFSWALPTCRIRMRRRYSHFLSMDGIRCLLGRFM